VAIFVFGLVLGDKINLVYFWNFVKVISKKMSGVNEKVYNMYERRQAIPVLYVRGTHYDVGYDVVTFMILNLINSTQWHNDISDDSLSLKFKFKHTLTVNNQEHLTYCDFGKSNKI
jgi:hypothetical protein